MVYLNLFNLKLKRIHQFMINAKDIKNMALLFITASVLNSCLIFAQAEANEEDQLRWFEVEVILYKSTSNKGLSNESWATDTQMKLPENVIDFLQPFEELEPVDSADVSVEIPSDESRDHANTNATDPRDLTADFTQDNLQVEKENAFVKLDESLLQLTAEARNISRHSSYNLLAHFAWRQPVLSKKEAPDLRIAGGFDHQQAFDYSGEKKLEKIADEEQFELQDRVNTITDTTSTVPTKVDTSIADSDSIDSGKEFSVATEDKQPVALPWVPEVDGSIRVYIHRNYLHVDTDLYYRRPGKEELDIFELPPQLPSLEEQDFTSADQVGSDLISDNSLDNDPLSNQNLEIELQQESLNAFAWEYDGDFLSNDTEKVFTERLFNYPLKQKRRLRSKQLNYFDHPLIGMLVIITPYEIKTDETTTEEIAADKSVLIK